MNERDRNERVRLFGWEVLADVLRRRWPIVGFTLLSALVAVGVSLSLPNQYVASARLLIPDQSNSLMSAFLGGTRGTAARLLSGGVGGSPYTRSLAILSSRGVGEALIDSFQLTRHYEIEPGPSAREETLQELAARSTFEVDSGYEYLGISVRDESPRRAADMANYYVALLNDRNTALASQNAATYRSFIEARYERANRSLDSLLDAVRAFQQRSGVIDLEAQGAAYFSQMGQIRAEQARLQVQLQSLRAAYGPESPEVGAAEQALQEATRQYQRALAGQDNALPVSRSQVPSVIREYADLERERIVQKSIMETLTPMVEAARLEEMRRTEMVQIVDLAVPPAHKATPRRSAIVLVAALSALLLATAAAVLWGQWVRQKRLVRERLDAVRLGSPNGG